MASSLARMYFELVKKDHIKIEQVPKRYRAEVQEMIDNYNKMGGLG